jgi:hypothetical protein
MSGIMPTLDEGKTGTIGADGRAVVTIGPNTPSSRWVVRNIAVSSTSAIDTECRVYYGNEAPQNLIAGTFSGNRDNVGVGLGLNPGSVLTAVWENGFPGATVSVSVYGDLNVDRAARGRTR